jgi:hypothetical protein
MDAAKYSPLPLLALTLLGACISEDASILNAEAHDYPVPITGLEAEPAEPGALPERGVCGEVVGDGNFWFGDYTLANPQDVVAFAGRSAITGRLDIIPGEALDLSSLAGLRCIGADLHIGGGLESLEGLHALEYVGGHLIIEAAPALGDLDGLRDLRFVLGELRVRTAHSLHNLAGLKHVGSVGHLTIDENDSLETIDGLWNLVDVDGAMLVHANPRLRSLNSLNKVAHVGTSLRVMDNPRLSRCEVLEWIETIPPNGQTLTIDVEGNDDNGTCK